MMTPSRPSVPGLVKAPRVEDGLRAILLAAFAEAISASQPGVLIPSSLLPRPSSGRVLVVGAGKAAWGMASAVLNAAERESWPNSDIGGLIIIPQDNTLTGSIVPAPAWNGRDRLGGIQVRRGRHPIPDDDGVAATVELTAMAAGLGEKDVLITLWSGGGSALLCEPRGVNLQEKQEVLALLMRAGAPIAEINLVRRHLSGVKGGQFVRRTGAGLITSLVLSDVVGDELAVIASGPTVPDPTTFAEALAVLDRHRLAAPAVRSALRRGVRGELPETPKPGDRIFRRVRTRVIGSGREALDGAMSSLKAAGLSVSVVDSKVTGLAIAAAERDAARARSLPPGAAHLTNGECTVEVRGRGRGGRNLEYLLALALALDGEPGVWALAADTDGIDGTSDAAGAVIGPDTLARADAVGVDAAACLSDNDAHGFFEAIGDLVKPGPTGTNVNDLHIIARMP